MNRNWKLDAVGPMVQGVDSASPPLALPTEKCAWAVNSTFRGGYWTQRPGFLRRPLTFDTDLQTPFETGGKFQGARAYNADAGGAYIVSSIGGRLFQIDLSDYSVTEITVTGDASSEVLDLAYFEQAEQFLIIRDGQSKPVIYDGAVSRRALQGEVPSGRALTYGLGRIWSAMGRLYTAGDIVMGDSGTATYSFRDSVLKWTENTYIGEGYSFVVPAECGDINAMVVTEQIDTSLGQGMILLFAPDKVFSCNAPVDRDSWIALSEPLQTVVLPSAGCVGPRALDTVNGDVWFRSQDGVRSLILARRDYSGPGNTPMSVEMERLLKADSLNMLKYESVCRFDNRLLITTTGHQHPVAGCYFDNLAVLNFDGISRLTGKTSGAWEGVWTGLQFLQVLRVRVDQVDRCFIFALDENDKIVLWELTKDAKFDTNVVSGTRQNNRITWMAEFRAMDFGLGMELKRLDAGWVWFDQLMGAVNFRMDFKSDQYPCFLTWESWQKCAPVENCGELDDDGCLALTNYQPQYSPRMALAQPPDTCNTVTGKPMRHGFTFQMKLVVNGPGRMLQAIFAASPIPQSAYPECLS